MGGAKQGHETVQKKTVCFRCGTGNDRALEPSSETAASAYKSRKKTTDVTADTARKPSRLKLAVLYVPAHPHRHNAE